MTPGEQFGRFRLFVISYGPLWLMLASRAAPEGSDWRWSAPNTWVSALLALGTVWSFVDAWRLVRGAQRKAAIRMRFAEIRDEGSAAAGYLATYLVPLLAEAPSRPGVWLAYALYLGMAVILFVRTDLALVNPTLYVFGWRVVSAVPGSRRRASDDAEAADEGSADLIHLVQHVDELDPVAPNGLAARYTFYALCWPLDDGGFIGFIKKMDPRRALKAGKRWFQYGDSSDTRSRLISCLSPTSTWW